MSSSHPASTLVDPIAAFVASRAGHEEPPIPLEAMAIDVTIRGGLALVESKRTYHNQEKKPIEALLTFPVPVQAAFFGLTAKIGDRHLRGIAQEREEARETYEKAIDKGKTAVLHEEVLRGVHSLSVANLAAGETIEVTIRWAEVLRCTRNHGRLRIPMTLGDVYGSSKLPEVDEPVPGGKTLSVSLHVWHDAGSINLRDAEPVPSSDSPLSVKVHSDTPIDLQFNDWKPGVLHGQSRSGEVVSLRIEPTGDHEENLDVAVLVDRSGSMSARCSTVSGTAESVHECVRYALFGLPEQLRRADRVALWQFDHRCEALGSGLPVPPNELAELIGELKPPRGGTEIGKAINRVIRADSAPDLLLITDGLSYELEVQRLASRGRRVFVVLVGEQSLEANVGHLAALTGGDLHFSFGNDIATALQASVEGLRSKGERPRFKGGNEPQRIRAHRGNAVVEAWWDGRGEPSEPGMFSSAVAAYAASLALGSMKEPAAMRLAASEGLVTHLTSLVLVDEKVARSGELPTTRKIKLSTPATAHAVGIASQIDASPHPDRRRARARPMRRSGGSDQAMYSMGFEQVQTARSDGIFEQPEDTIDPVFERSDRVKQLARRIDWSQHGDRLAHGVLDGIDPEDAGLIRHLSKGVDAGRGWRTGLWNAAYRRGGDPTLPVIMCLAAFATPESSEADLVRRRILERLESAVQEILQEAEHLRRRMLELLEPAIYDTLRDAELGWRKAFELLMSEIHDAIREEFDRPSTIHEAILAEIR